MIYLENLASKEIINYKKLKILFIIPAPKELYMYNQIGLSLIKDGHIVKYLIRDFGPNKIIAKHFKIDYYLFGKNYFRGLFGKIFELLFNFLTTFKLIVNYRPDIIVGDTLFGFPSKLLRIPSIAIVEGDPIGLSYLIFKHLYQSDCFIIPSCTNLVLKNKNIIKYNGIQELIYINDNFKADLKIYDYLMISENTPYVVIRLSNLGMSHDVGLKTLTIEGVEKIVSVLKKQIKVFISSEKILPNSLKENIVNIPPYLYHSLLHYATLFIGDTASNVEAALLGTPSIQISPINFNGNLEFKKYGYFSLCENNKLIRIISPLDVNNIIMVSQEIINNSDSKLIHENELKNFLKTRKNINNLIIKFIEDYPNSINYLLKIHKNSK